MLRSQTRVPSRPPPALRALLACLALGVSAAALAVDEGLGIERRPDALAEEPDFLPVDEAYRFSARLADGVIVARWRIAPGYYLYRQRFEFTPAGATLGDPVIPPGKHKVDEFFGEVEVHYDDLAIEVPVAGQSAASFSVAFGYQGCADAGLCYPPEVKTVAFDTGAAPVTPAAAGGGEWAATLAEVAAVLGAALLGGLILNLMPCVFPVLAIKAISLIEADARRRARHAAGYAAGVIVTFLVLGGVLALLRGAGEAIGWGFQLQSPGFVTAMGLVFFLLGLNLLGVFEVPGFGVAVDGANAFFAGVIAVVVATPCTAPFMGAALGYGLSQSPATLLAVMAALGAGLALPYVLLATIPRLADRLPRPGPWMATLKQALAFPLFATVVWLLWVLARQAGADAVLGALLGCLALGFLAWLAAGRAARLRLAWGGAAAMIVAGAWLAPAAQRPAADGFDMAAVEASVAAGEPVFLNFTAAWCITCLANERTTLSTDRVQRFFAANGIRQVKGDWTNEDPAITVVLTAFGRSGVPLYVFYPARGEPVLLPQILTPGIVIETITRTAGATTGELRA